MILSPVKLAREAVVANLAHSSHGFNIVYSSCLGDYAGAPAMSIDFVSPNSRNFFLGDVDTEAVEETGIFKYPLLTVYGAAGAGRNFTKFQRFSGLVKIGARFFLSSEIYKASHLKHDYEVWPDAVENAFITSINKPDSSYWPSFSQYSVVYNGDISWDRKFPMEAGTGWLQILGFQLTFEVEIT